MLIDYCCMIHSLIRVNLEWKIKQKEAMKMNHIQFTSKQIYLSIVCLLAFLNFQACSQIDVYENEKNILLELKQLWGLHQYWDSNSSLCTWYGLECTNGSVTSISMEPMRITGTTISPIICGLKSLKRINLSGNKFRGEFPTFLYNCSKLEFLDLSWNQLHGPLPSDLHRLSRLIHLDVAGNSFDEIPGSIGQLSELRYLSLKFNNFNNSIPREIGNLSKLETLDMSYIESFKQARIPEELGRLKKLTDLVIVGSNLIGEIPETFSALSGLRSLDLSFNYLQGSIPGYLFRSKNLTSLRLDYNRFSGSLPSLDAKLMGITREMFSNLSGLEVLDLSGNRLNGSIPIYLFLFKNLYILSLQDNQFSGSLPSIARKLRLRTLDLSKNRLSGYIPQEYDKNGYFFSDNLNLCTKYTNRYIQVRRCSGKKRIVIAAAVSTPIALLVIVTFLFYVVKKNRNFSTGKFLWRKKWHENQDPEWMFTSFQRLGFVESEILVNMTEENLIGSGGSGKVYRVGVNPNGNFVAVKRIWNKRNLDRGLEKQFLAEVEVLGSIRHSNIVKLLCCISSGNSKVLVYEYMENRSLDEWLHHKRRVASARCVLEWRTRLQIAVGAARGLCYMHHECSPPIIHRDIKCSNILLDDKLNAKIADFGLAKVLANWGETETASAIAGTIGYLAPEYAYTSKVNFKSDVYSFGVVLLELVTGREPVKGEEHINLAQWAWNHHEQGNPIVDAIDEEIKEACFLKEMSSVFKLGLICTSTVPCDRPSMKEVLQILLLSLTNANS